MNLINSPTKKIVWIFGLLTLAGTIILLIIHGFSLRNLLAALSMSFAFSTFFGGIIGLLVVLIYKAFRNNSSIFASDQGLGTQSVHLANLIKKIVITWKKLFGLLVLLNFVAILIALLVYGLSMKNLLIAVAMSFAYSFSLGGLFVSSIAVYRQALDEYSIVLKPGGKSHLTDKLRNPDPAFYQLAFSFLTNQTFSKKQGSSHHRKAYGKVYLSSYSLAVALVVPMLLLLPPQFGNWIIYLTVTGLGLSLFYFSLQTGEIFLYLFLFIILILFIPPLLQAVFLIPVALVTFLKDFFVLKILFISGIVALPIANYLMKRFRDLHLYVDAVNHQPMQRVNDEITNKQLSEPEKVAQQLGSVSFEGWKPADSDEDKDIHILAYVLPSEYKECPECKELTVGKNKKVLEEATYTSSGIRLITYQCRCCDYSHTVEKTIPRKRRASSRSSYSSVSTNYGGYSGGSSGGSSGGDGGGSSFGGGDSGGGGAGGGF